MAKVWNADTGQELLTVKENGGVVVSACLSSDGTRFATATSQPVKVWNVDTNPLVPSSGQPMILRTDGQAGGLLLMCFSPDGRTLASGSLDGKVRLWDVTDGK